MVTADTTAKAEAPSESLKTVKLCSTSHWAAPDSIKALPSSRVAAIKISIFHSTLLSASLKSITPTAGRVMARAPSSATSALSRPCSGCVDHNKTSVVTTPITYHSLRPSGPVTLIGFLGSIGANSFSVNCSGCRRSSALRNRRKMIQVESRQLARAKGKPSMVQRRKLSVSPPMRAMMSTVTKWAPAPINEATAESRMMVGKSKASARLIRGLLIPLLSARKTGNINAARPEVAGIKKAVAIITKLRL